MAYFAEAGGFVETPVYDRYALRPGAGFAGPAIVEERESTAVVGPGGRCRVDDGLALIVGMLRSTRYEVADREVIVRSTPFRWRIEIESIESIRPSRSPASSPALSLDRLEIRYGGGRTLLVSPKDREGFLAAVVARSRHLHRAGEHVRRV